jgi:AcrR family transcriptional regulator
MAKEKKTPAGERGKPAAAKERAGNVGDEQGSRRREPAKERREGRKEKQESTEQKIKEAARKLFTQKGFAATRTRDIAEEAGLNLALLNYYFRSKQKLFDIIMMENFRQFLGGMSASFQDEQMTLEEKVSTVVNAYIDFLTDFPDLPLFILNELKGNPSKLATQVNEEVAPARGHFFKELQKAKNEGKIALDPFHFVANLVGLTVFPFVARPLLQRVTNVSDEQFRAYMEDRRRLVPAWVGMMMRTLTT